MYESALKHFGAVISAALRKHSTEGRSLLQSFRCKQRDLNRDSHGDVQTAPHPSSSGRVLSTQFHPPAKISSSSISMRPCLIFKFFFLHLFGLELRVWFVFLMFMEGFIICEPSAVPGCAGTGPPRDTELCRPSLCFPRGVWVLNRSVP